MNHNAAATFRRLRCCGIITSRNIDKIKDFENFEELSQAYFDECTRKKMKKELEALSVSEEERAQMTELAVEMNRNYFAGMIKPEKEMADTPGWKLWKEKGAELFFGSYMDSMMEDAGHDENRLLLPPKSDAGNR